MIRSVDKESVMGKGEFNFLVEDIEGFYSNDESLDVDSAEQSVLKDGAPPIRRVRSKFSNGVRILEIVATLIENGAKYSLKIHSDTNEISDFRKHKGSYATIYYFIKPMLGDLLRQKIERIERAYAILIKRYMKTSTENNLLVLIKVAKLYEEKVHHVMMISKVSFETETLGGGPVARQRILT